MYSGIISNKTPDHHLDDQALIFSGEKPSREQPERPQEQLHIFLFLDSIYILIYITRKRKVIYMMTAKVFKNGRSQAIRLPKECRFSSDEVVVNKIGDIVILLPKQNKWDSFMKAIDMFSDDFMADGRTRDSAQEREEL